MPGIRRRGADHQDATDHVVVHEPPGAPLDNSKVSQAWFLDLPSMGRSSFLSIVMRLDLPTMGGFRFLNIAITAR